jgi:hypothetical protein
MKKFYLFSAMVFMAMNLFAQLEGTWRLAPAAGSLAVGPAQGDYSWWSNSAGDVSVRSCLFDDSLTFGPNGALTHYMDGSTWVEGWQGATGDGCNTPVAPHDGTTNAPYTYSYNSSTGELTLNGIGAHMGLAKVINGGEINNPANAASSITYISTFSNNNNTLTLEISIGGGWWKFVYQRTNAVTIPDPNVTFRVNMSNYTGTIATGVFVNGSFNGWCGTCNPMTNTTGSIWEVTLPLAPSAIEYKFTVDGWNDQENFTGTEACIDPINDGFYNRYHVVAGDITLAPVCFNSCDICTNDITFRVNMNDYVTGGGSTAAGVFLNGTFNGWCGTCTPMADANMDGVWEVTAPIAAGNIEYKFTVDGWNVSEQFVGGETCTITNGGFTNRAGTVTTDSTLAVVCWQSCLDCPAGIDELNENGIVIAPNPATTALNVSAKSEIQTVAILDLNGRLVQSLTVNGVAASINVSGMNHGLYLVSVTTNKGVYTKRVIVE